MKKQWMICIDGTPTLKKGVKYLVEFRGLKVKVIRDEFNPHRSYGNIVNVSRFRKIWTREELNLKAQKRNYRQLSLYFD